jgi:hypothetical protein
MRKVEVRVEVDWRAGSHSDAGKEDTTKHGNNNSINTWHYS